VQIGPVALDDGQGIAATGMDAEQGMKEGQPKSSIGGTADSLGMSDAGGRTIDVLCADQDREASGA
jgi:hypothetical protein